MSRGIQILDKNGKVLSTAKDSLELSDKAQGLVMDLVKQSHSVYRREINDWQRARLARESVENPRTYLQQQIYTDAMLDTHLSAVTENRILRIQNKRFIITDDKGIIDPDKTQLVTKKWFSDVLRYVMESVLYEYSLIHLTWEQGEITHSSCVPRGHVIPEKGIVVKNVYDDRGLNIEMFPDDLLMARLYGGRGLLEKASPLTILKRHSWASWDEFEQIFGMPIRIAKMGSMNDKVKNEVAGWLESMGTAAYGVFPESAEIEIKESNNRDAFNVFFKKIEAVDSQNSILINGQTMTVSDGSSQSQANVHERTQGEITEADLKGVLYWLNDVLLPAMRRRGYPISETERIDVERVTNPLDKMKTDEKLMQNGYVLSDDYIERVYGVELAERPKEEDDKTNKKGKDKKGKKKS